ncbi:MAG: IS110 family transposase [Bacteroidota bacterium]
MTQIGYLGIDVSKGYADFILLNDSKETLGKGYKLYDNRQGHESLFNRLQAAKVKYGLDQIICGVESTGGYENNWYNSLWEREKQISIIIKRLNPKGVKHQGASKMTRTITDQVSARNISLQLIENKDKILQHPTPDLKQSQARRYYRYIQTLNQQKTAMTNRLEKLVYSAFPELLCYARHGMPNWMIKLLLKYPDYQSIKKAKPSSLVKIKGITKDKIVKLKSLAQHSVGQPTDVLLARTISSLAQQIIEITEKIKEEKLFLQQHYHSEQVSLLEQTKGIGKYSAIGIVMEVENVERFESGAKMASFFGVHPVFKQSGDGKVKARMSKQGSASYRSTIYMAARNVCIHNPYFKEIYAKFRAKGMNDAQAIGAIMHKLTRVVFGILKSKKPFDAQVDQNNRNKKLQQQKSKLAQMDQKQILKEVEMIKNAPCSSRTFKRKKAELQPQTP